MAFDFATDSGTGWGEPPRGTLCFNWFELPSGEREPVCRRFNACPGGAACAYDEHSCEYVHGCVRRGALGHGVADGACPAVLPVPEEWQARTTQRGRRGPWGP